jgi:hypothetical protein
MAGARNNPFGVFFITLPPLTHNPLLRLFHKSTQSKFGLTIVDAPTTKAVVSECVIKVRTDGFSRRTAK